MTGRTPHPLIGPVPPGFVSEAAGRGVLVCREGERDALLAAGFAPGALRDDEALPDAQEAGREPLGRLVVAGAECLVRRFSHGGLARALTGRRFRDPRRPFEELRLSERLRAAGVATPRVVAARAVRARGWGYELSLVVERVPDTVDVGRLVGDVRAGRAPKGALRRAVADAGLLVGRLHALGFLHADLQPANLLVHRDGRRGAWALDLDRSRFVGHGPLAADLAVANLGRLWRHVERREGRYGAVLRPGDLALFLARYGVPRADLGARMEAVDAAAARGRAAHRAGWLLEAALGRRHDARAR